MRLSAEERAVSRGVLSRGVTNKYKILTDTINQRDRGSSAGS